MVVEGPRTVGKLGLHNLMITLNRATNLFAFLRYLPSPHTRTRFLEWSYSQATLGRAG